MVRIGYLYLWRTKSGEIKVGVAIKQEKMGAIALRSRDGEFWLVPEDELMEATD